MKGRKFGLVFLVIFALFFLTVPISIFAYGQVEEKEQEIIRLGVFIPGALGDSPPYDAIADTARAVAAREEKLELVNVFEAGFNQSKWAEQLYAFASSGRYDVIYTSNEALGGMVVEVARDVPNVKFIITDSYIQGHDQIFSTFPNKWEQGYFYGYMMALISSSTMSGANPDKKIGLIFGQHYVMMDEIIIPSMRAGAKAVDPEFELITVMLGNWFDATRAESLALNLISMGVDTIGTIAGSANVGVVRAAANNGKYVALFEPDGFHRGPGTVVACSGTNYDLIAKKDFQALIDGTIPWGKAYIAGAQEGFISVPLLAPGWVDNVPEATRKEFEQFYNNVLKGKILLPAPQNVLDRINAAAMGK